MSDYGFDFRNQDFPGEFAEANPLALAHDLIAREQANSALELLSQHREDLGEHPQYLILCARAWTAIGDFARAQHALLAAIRKSPDDPAPLVLLGELLLERGELERARRVVSKVRELAPDDRAVSRLQRRLREQRVLQESTEGEEGPGSDPSLESGSDDLIAAAEEQERARLDAPESSRSGSRRLLTLAALLVVLGAAVFGVWLAAAPDASEPEVSPVPRDEPLDSPQLASSRGLSLPESIGKPPAPLRPSLMLPASEPGESEPDPAPSSSEAQRLKTLSWKQLSRDPAALSIRADQLYAAGRRARAASLYRRALRLRPGYAPAMLGVSRSLMHAGNTRAAMSLATRVIESDAPKTPAVEAMALYLVGRIHHQRGERVSAKRILREATSLPDAPPEAWFFLGESLSGDNSRAAREAYEQYLREVPDGSLAARARKAIQ